MKKEIQKSKYQLIWHFIDQTKKEEVDRVIGDHLEELEKKLKATLSYEIIGEAMVIFQAACEKLSGHKFLQGLCKQLNKLFADQGLQQAVFNDKEWMILTLAETLSESVRLQRLFHGIRETFYYDVKHIYGPDIQLLEKKMQGRKIGILDWGDKVFLIDEKALTKPINLNCMACTSKHDYGCCCGSPCNYSNKNLKIFKAHEEEIMSELKRIEPAYYEAIQSKFAKEESCGQVELVGFDGTVGECEGRCMLLVREDGFGKCLAHKYALEHQMPIYTISPLSCLMFPFEVIEMINDKNKRLFLLTGVVEDDLAESIGRWGSYSRLGIPLPCTDVSLCNDEFKKADYQPVYKVNKGLITHEFGTILYEGLALSLNKNS